MASSTKRRGNAGRDRTGGSGSSPSSGYRPQQVHPIIQETRRDKPVSKPSSAHKDDDTSIASARHNAEQAEKEQQEQLEVLQNGADTNPDQASELFDNPVDRWTRADLDLADADTSTQASSGGSTIGPDRRPTSRRTESGGKGSERSGSTGSSDNSSNTGSGVSPSNDSDSIEKKKFKDIAQDEKQSLANRLQTDRDNIKPEKISGWKFRGKTKSKLKKAILGALIAVILAVPIGFIGVIPHAIQKWIENRASVYVERASDKIGQKILFSYIRDRVAVNKCKGYYSSHLNVTQTSSCRPRLDTKDGRLSQLFNDWNAAKMEDLLEESGIEVRYDPGKLSKDGKPYSLIVKGNVSQPITFSELEGEDWHFENMGRRETAKKLIPQMKEAQREKTRWWEYLRRRNEKAGYLRDLNLPKHFWAPNSVAKKLDDLEAKKALRHSKFRKFLAQHVIQVGRGRIANFIGILFGGKSVSREDVIDMNKEGRKAVRIIKDSKLDVLIQNYAGKNAKEIAKEIVIDVVSMLTRNVARQVITEIVESISKALPIIGWILLAFTILDLVEMLNNGTVQKFVSGMNSQSMLDMSNLMNTTLSEERRGYVDVESGGDMRLSLIKGLSSSRIFTNTTGYKSPNDKQAEGYDCRPNVSLTDINSIFEGGAAIFTDGDSSNLEQVGMEKGQDACENHRVDYDILKVFTKWGIPQQIIDKLLYPYTKDCVAIPFTGLIAEYASKLIPGAPVKCRPTAQDIYHGYESVISWFTDNAAVNWALEAIAKFPPLKFITEKLTGFIVNSISILITGNSLAGPELLQGGLHTDTKTGARFFDSWSGGQQVLQNSFAKGVGTGGGLGSIALDHQEASTLNNSIASERKEELASGSIFERMFDVSHADTLASGAMTVAIKDGSFSNLVNPFNNIALAFNTASPSTFAGNNDQQNCGDTNRFGEAVTEFGVVCYGTPDSLIDGLSEDDLVKFSDPVFCKEYTAALDKEIKDNEDKPYPSTDQDPDGSGQANKPNYCRLMCTATDTMGTNFRTNDKICGFEKFSAGTSSGSSGDGSDDSGGGGGGGSNEPVEGALGKCEGVEVTRPNAGSSHDIEVQVVPGTTIDVLAELCVNVLNMVNAARADGVVLNGGGFRTYAEQVKLRIKNCGSSYYQIYQTSSSNCHPPTAIPGTSMHESGRAIDFDSCSSHGTACWKWLNSHAASFGYKNLPKEPWHWSTNGK